MNQALMGLTNEHVEPKLLAKIKIYVLTRAELLFTLCYEIPCKTLVSMRPLCKDHVQACQSGECWGCHGCISVNFISNQGQGSRLCQPHYNVPLIFRPSYGTDMREVDILNKTYPSWSRLLQFTCTTYWPLYPSQLLSLQVKGQ